jgi:hypothetical protein
VCLSEVSNRVLFGGWDFFFYHHVRRRVRGGSVCVCPRSVTESSLGDGIFSEVSNRVLFGGWDFFFYHHVRRRVRGGSVFVCFLFFVFFLSVHVTI